MPRGSVEKITAVLEACQALAITCRAANDQAMFDEPDGERTPLWSRCELIGLFECGTVPHQIERALLAAGCGQLEVSASELKGRAWATIWQDQFKPIRFGEHLWVVPSWCEPPPGARTIIRLDPGMAFGTGTHPSTAMCLAWIADSPAVRGASVLDYGCGSGILAIAAAKCGAETVQAVDIDIAAIKVARDNVALNGCHGVEVKHADDLEPTSVDILIANILFHTIVELKADFADRVKVGGTVCLSGLLVEQVDLVLDTYRSAFKMEPPVKQREWALLVGRRI